MELKTISGPVTNIRLARETKLGWPRRSYFAVGDQRATIREAVWTPQDKPATFLIIEGDLVTAAGFHDGFEFEILGMRNERTGQSFGIAVGSRIFMAHDFMRKPVSAWGLLVLTCFALVVGAVSAVIGLSLYAFIGWRLWRFHRAQKEMEAAVPEALRLAGAAPMAQQSQRIVI